MSLGFYTDEEMTCVRQYLRTHGRLASSASCRHLHERRSFECSYNLRHHIRLKSSISGVHDCLRNLRSRQAVLRKASPYSLLDTNRECAINHPIGMHKYTGPCAAPTHKAQLNTQIRRCPADSTHISAYVPRLLLALPIVFPCKFPPPLRRS